MTVKLIRSVVCIINELYKVCDRFVIDHIDQQRPKSLSVRVLITDLLAQRSVVEHSLITCMCIQLMRTSTSLQY